MVSHSLHDPIAINWKRVLILKDLVSLSSSSSFGHWLESSLNAKGNCFSFSFMILLLLIRKKSYSLRNSLLFLLCTLLAIEWKLVLVDKELVCYSPSRSFRRWLEASLNLQGIGFSFFIMFFWPLNGRKSSMRNWFCILFYVPFANDSKKVLILK